MTDFSKYTSIPFLQPGQSLKYVTVNQALAKIDSILHISVKDIGLNDPPVDVQNLDRYIIGNSPVGVWAGHPNAIAKFDVGEWEFILPQTGWLAWVEQKDQLVAFSDDKWHQTSRIDEIETIGIGTAKSDGNGLTVKSNASLFTAKASTEDGTGDFRLSINRSGPSATASVIFQTDHGGNAECGLLGDDSLTVKTSADGESFQDAIKISQQTGYVGIGTIPDSLYRLNCSDNRAGTSGIKVENLNTENGASASLNLRAAAGHYFNFQLYGSGAMYAYSNATMYLGTYASKPIRFRTDTTDRMMIHADGRISIGSSSASADLSVNGSIRAGQYTPDALPSAVIAGTGAMIFVTGERAAMAYSDGTNWRYMSSETLV